MAERRPLLSLSTNLGLVDTWSNSYLKVTCPKSLIESPCARLSVVAWTSFSLMRIKKSPANLEV